MMTDIRELAPPKRWLIAAVAGLVLVTLVVGWFGVRWQIGNMLAALTPASDPAAEDISDAARSLAPGDPMTARFAAAVSDTSEKALELYESAARLAPNDYRRRIDLARAYEQDGSLARAEAEYRRSVELAPSHAGPRWFLGNFLLRQEREADALAELQAAASHNRNYREQVFSLLWDYFGKDAARIETLVEEPAAVAHLAFFFAARGAAEPAVRSWRRLSQAEQERYRYRAVQIADGLFIQRHFPESLEFFRFLGEARGAAHGAVANASFEDAVADAESSRFLWQIFRNESKIEVLPDGRTARMGGRSLRLTFRGYSKPALANVYQTVIVSPGHRYALAFWFRTADLRSPGMPMVEVLNAVDDKTLARSRPFASGTEDWRQEIIEFDAPTNCEAITIRTIREFCGEECALTGTVWYDDFELKRH